MESTLDSMKDEMIGVGKRVYDRGFVASNDGNISLRLDERSVLITPTGVSKGFMKRDDLIIIDMDARLIEGKRKPSSESNMHVQIYKDRPDVNGICHAHPPYATGFAVAGIPLDKMILPEFIIAVGRVPVVEYGTTGTYELYGAMAKYIQDYDAFLLANHGATTVGSSVLSAYHKMETLEHAAKIQFLAHQLGRINELNKKQVSQLISLREKFGIRKDVGLKPVRRPRRK
ncbi:MAG TPA: class II aldolase/adducin family protein [Candidatus Kryptonia bacterium]